jgi:hypothetical protein
MKASSRSVGECGEFLFERGAESLALLGDDLDAVGVQQLIVAERGRDRAGSRPILFETGLGIVFAVAADLEGVDPNRLLSRKSGRTGDLA